MKERNMGQRSVLQERVNILKSRGYRGFRVSKGEGKMENAIEVGARNKAGILLIAVGDTLDEAYENLIERIDLALDEPESNF